MISDKDLQQAAKNLIKSMSVKPKEAVMISSGSSSIGFAERLAYEAAIIGANPSISYGSDALTLKIYKKINQKYLKTIPKLSKILARKVDVEIMLDDTNPFIAKQLPQKKIQIRRKALKTVSNIRDERVVKKTIKSVLVGYPTKEIAKTLGMPFEKLSSIFWSTMTVNPYEQFAFNNRIIQRLKGAEKIHIVGKNTDLELSVKGREPLNDCGLWEKDKIGYLNLPGGEVFYAPVENSANGEILFDLPCLWHYGKQVEGVWFKFKNGKVVDYSIKKGEKAFEEVMRNATGNKKSIAELGIGTNPNAKRTGGLTIVDEKIRGTIHIAIGWNKGFGGKNDSTIHWDFFKNMMLRGSRVFVDGKVLMKDGKFVLG
jgi:aminopeptidase